MGRKRDTLIRWVNCCCESGEPFERLHELSNGLLFLEILGHNSNITHPFNTCPWVTIVKLLKEINITEELINFNSAALGDEEEIAKLVAVCMHLTMVVQPRDDIKEKTMNLLSAEDQLVIKTILHAFVSDDKMTKNQLAEIVYDVSQELNYSRGACTFYTSSPASSVGKNSPLKRYLDSPMAMRLSRLQREINEKNEEIRRLQADMISESDENTILRQRLDDLNRKVKVMDKKNAELLKRLDECRSEGSSGDQPADAQLDQVKKQLKRLQSEYEAMSQKYCDLNISHENLIGQREKDRKQMRQLQNELNEEVARLQRETADLQLQLDTVQTENMEMKHLLDEKKQWIEVLQDQSRTCATEHNATNFHHHHHNLQANSPQSAGMFSPSKQRESIAPGESIGFTLLSLEVEKLQDELTANRTELFVEKEKLKSQREAFQMQEQSLNQEISRINQQLGESAHANHELEQQLEQAQTHLREVTERCTLVQQEKTMLAGALDVLHSESNEQKHLIGKLEQKLEETLRRRDGLEKEMEALTTEKVGLLQRIAALQQENLETLSCLETKRTEFRQELDRVNGQLQANQQQMDQQSAFIQELQQQLGQSQSQLETLGTECARWEAESKRLAVHSADLESHLHRSTEEFQAQLLTANQQLEEGRHLLNSRDETIRNIRSELEDAHRTIERESEKSLGLEKVKEQLSLDIVHLQEELVRSRESAESTQLKLNSDIDSLRRDIQEKELEYLQQCDVTSALEQTKSELMQQKEQLQANIAVLENEKEQQLNHRNTLEQQIAELNSVIEGARTEMESVTAAYRNQLEVLGQQLRNEENKSDTLDSQLQDTIRQKDEFQSLSAHLETEKQSLIEKADALEREKNQIETSLSQTVADLTAQLMSTTGQLGTTQQQLTQQEQATANIRSQLEAANRDIIDARTRCSQLESEKMEMVNKSISLQEEKASIEASLSQAIDDLQSKLTTAISETENIKQQKVEQEKELAAAKNRLDTLVSQHEDLQTRFLHLKNERDCLKRNAVASEEERAKLKSTLSQTTAEFENRLVSVAQELDAVKQQRATQADELVGLREQIDRATRERQDLQVRSSHLETEKGNLEEKLMAVEKEKMETEASLTRSNVEFQNLLSNANSELELVKAQRSQQEEQIVAVRKQIEDVNQQQQDLQARYVQLESERDSLKHLIASLEHQKAQVETNLNQTVSVLESRLLQSAEQLKLLQQEKTVQQEEVMELHKQMATLNDQLESQKTRLSELESERADLNQQVVVLRGEKTQVEASLVETTAQFENQLAEISKELDCVKQHRAHLKDELVSTKSQSGALFAQLEAEKDSMRGKLLELEQGKAEVQEDLTRSLADCHRLQEQKELLLSESAQFREDIASLQQTFNELKTQAQLTTEQLNSKLQAKNDEIAAQKLSIQAVEKQLEETRQAKAELEEQFQTKVSTIQQQSQVIEELNSCMESILARQSVLQDACKEMESVRNGLESSLAQAEAEAEARAQFQVDVNILRNKLQVTEGELARKVEQLTETEMNLKATIAKHESKIIALEQEKSELFNARNVLETERATIRADLEEAQRQLLDEAEKVRQSESQLSDVRREMERLQRRHHELQLEKNSLSEQKSTIELRLSELESSSQASRTALESELRHLRSELDARQTQIMEQSDTINTLELNIQNSSQRFRNLELETDSLQSAIEEMSNGREELMRQCSMLESAQMEYRTQIEELNEKLRAKQTETQELSTQLKNLTAQRDRLLQDQLALEQKVAGLEADLLVLRSANEEERISAMDAINRLEQELQKKSMEHFDSINVLQSDMEQMETTLKSVEKQLGDISAEKDRLIHQQNRLKMEKIQLKEALEAAKQQFQESSSCTQEKLEGKEREILDLMDQLKAITTQLAATSKLNGELEEKIRQLEADKENLLREKRALEEAQEKLMANRRDLELQLESGRQELEAKNTAIRLSGEDVERLKSQLLEAARVKDELETELSQRQALQASEKDNLSQKNTWLEEELARLKSTHQTTKAELDKERATVAQIRAELSLEHRKEKAALEARVQLAQSQVKSMQEKLVSLSFPTSHSHAQSQLENKVGLLTNELEAANKAKSELEKKFKMREEQLREEIVSYKQRATEQEQKLEQLASARASRSSNESELTKKYTALKSALAEKESIIEECNADLEKLKAHINGQQEEMAALAAEKKKLTFENRTLKNEQQYLLAQISAEKDRAAAKSSRLSLALQRGSSGAEGGSLADNLIEARRRSLRPSRSEVVSRPLDNEVFKAPRLVLGDGNETFKVPSIANGRRDSTSSIASNRSDVSTASRAGALPHGAGRIFVAEDEDGELFSSSYLNELKEGKCRVDDPSVRRMSELHRRNTLQPPHMRSAYPAELNDERLRVVDMPIAEHTKRRESDAVSVKSSTDGAVTDRSVQQLATATSLLSVSTPPAMNTRKRRSWAEMNETPVTAVPAKRRSVEKDRLSIDSMQSDTRSLASSIGSADRTRARRRESTQTTYQRPGPPTPARGSSMKENITCTPSASSSTPKETPKSNKAAPGSSKQKKNTSPQSSRSTRLTPAAFVRKVHSKIMSNKQSASGETTPGSSSTTPRGRSKLNIFRKPLGSRGYNSEVARF